MIKSSLCKVEIMYVQCRVTQRKQEDREHTGRLRGAEEGCWAEASEAGVVGGTGVRAVAGGSPVN